MYEIIATRSEEDYKSGTIEALHISSLVGFITYAVFNNETRIKTYMMCHTKINKVKRNLHNYGASVTNYRVIMLMITFLGITYILAIFDDLVFFKTLTYRKFLAMLEFTISNVLQLQFLYTALSINVALNIIKKGLKEELSTMIDDEKKYQYCYFTKKRPNNLLESINKTIDTIGMVNYILPNIYNAKRQKLAQRIFLINKSFVLTCDVLREFTSSDNILLFLQLLAFTSNIVFTCYKNVFLNQDDSLLLVKFLIHLMWFVYVIIKLIIIIEPYHLAQKKIKEIRLLVAEMMCYVTSESDPVIHEMEAFVNQLLLKDISYMALGICNLGRPVISGITGVITTVIIIILEW